MYLVPYLPKTMVDYHQKQQLLLNLIMDDKRTNPSQLDRFDSCYLTIHNTYMVNNYGNDLAMAIKERRILIPLTLRELGAKSGVSSSHLSRIEQGQRKPSSRTLQKVAKPLGFDLNELLILADYLSPEPQTLAEEQRDKLRAELNMLLERAVSDGNRIKEIVNRLLMTS